jgi:hypothetical protein
LSSSSSSSAAEQQPPVELFHDDCIRAIADCLEGMDRVYEHDVLRRHSYDDQQLEDLQMEKAQTQLDYIVHFWKQASVSSLMGEELVAICFGVAADAALSKNYRKARTLATLATSLEATVRLGGDKFDRCLDAPHRHGADLEPWIRGLRKIKTSNRALILYLARKVPCSCLHELKVQARKSPKVDRCHYCQKSFPRNHIKACANCETALYCSRECQRKDWRAVHKRLCKIVSYPP